MPVYKSKRKTKDGRAYFFQVNYTDSSGKYRSHKSKLYMTSAEAKQAEKDFQIDPVAHSKAAWCTFESLTMEYRAERKKALKPTSYRKMEKATDYIIEHLGNIRIDRLTKEQYQAFLDAIKGKGKASYVNKIIYYTKGINQLCQRRYSISSPVPDMFDMFKDTTTIKKNIDFFTLEEFSAFIEAVSEPKFRALFTTLFYCGLRLGEANALLWEDIDLNAKNLTISKSISQKDKDQNGNFLILPPKTKSSYRTLPMPEKVVAELVELKEIYSRVKGFSDTWYVFGALRPIPDTTIQNAKNRACDIAKVKRIRIHDFRHSCASLLINNGANITLVSQYLGHSNITQTLNTYSHFYQSKLNELITTINQL